MRRWRKRLEQRHDERYRLPGAVADRAPVALDDRPLFGVGDEVPFQLRLAQTVAWCTPRADPADPAGSLRSEELRPRVLETDRVATVQAVWVHRWLDNAVRSAEPARSAEDLGGGKLLVYFPDSNLSDGAAKAESGGFFDSDNVPPWDTWVGLFRDESADISYVDHLVSWVPGEFIDSVERGINVNPEDCILWLADSRVPLAAELRSRGLLG